MRPDANTTWFTFDIEGNTSFGVYAFEGVEEVHTPYEFVIELVHTSSMEDIGGYIGKTACLSITDRSGDSRPVHGVIRRMEQLHTSNLRTHYRCYLVPRLWFLDQIVDHRIFQNLTVPDIIQHILEEQGFDGSAVSFKLFLTYQPREYCVQYGETSLHFISRLCEEEGIYYYFEHSENSHCLCFCDREGGETISGENDLRYFQGSGHIADTAVISRLAFHHRSKSNAAAYREWNFEKPKLNQEVTAEEADPKKAPIPSGMQLEQYRYPHLYQFPEKGGTPPGTHGKQYVDVQLLRQIAFGTWVTGESDVARLVPGFVFTVNSFPREEVNARWWLTRVTHFAEQPQVLEHEAPERGLLYKAIFTAIPEMTRFVPEVKHPKRLVVGNQTAIVTGPEGEEIYPDKYGRVKVQFFWDRADLWNDKTTCWIRVSQGWAGSQFGTMAIPRIGHEVIVTFLEGNPDRPLITGRVYHAENMPPYALPEHKTRTVFKSMSTPGEKGQPRGFNEFRIEDKKSEEEIYVHAEKDVNVYVKNDWKEHILNDFHETVDNFRYTRIKGEDHLIVEQPRKVEVAQHDNLTVNSSSHTDVKEKWLSRAGEEIHLKSGMKVVIEAATDMTLKTGGSFIRLTPAGITLQAPSVKINSGGSAGTGTGANAQKPQNAILVAEGTPPKSVELPAAGAAKALKGSSSAGSQNGNTFVAVSGENLSESIADEALAPVCQLCALRAAQGKPFAKVYAPGEEA